MFGEGPLTAPVMFVGEQPGDQEDLAGKPFVGPAGQVFDRVMGEAGLDRRRAYVTNAVKHFKFTLRGKRRIHERPNAGEISACRFWLGLEREFVKPRLVVALGATALHALTGHRGSLASMRERDLVLDDGTALLATVHPSYLLRLPDEDTRARDGPLPRRSGARRAPGAGDEGRLGGPSSGGRSSSRAQRSDPEGLALRPLDGFVAALLAMTTTGRVTAIDPQPLPVSPPRKRDEERMGEELKGKRVLVTGASSGLGAHFVRLLAGRAHWSSPRRAGSSGWRNWRRTAPGCRDR